MKIQRTDYKCVNGVYVDNHRTGIREINYNQQYDCYVEYYIMFGREDFSDFFKLRYWQAEWDS